MGTNSGLKMRNPLQAAARPLMYVAAAVVLLVVFALGYLFRGLVSPSGREAEDHQPTAAQDIVKEWTCAMHPQIRQPKPGKCPICGMDLIPVTTEGEEEAGPRQFVTSEAAKQLMNIQVSPVERRFPTAEIRMVGKVDYDETRLAYITAWVPGRIDKLYVDYTGVEVEQGEHMVYLYSPELLVAQEELRRASRALADLSASAPEALRKSADATRQAAREKLRRWGLTETQIDDAEKKGITTDHITIYAPISGTVIERAGWQGMYVDIGTQIYAIADLSTVWVKLDAYESDLPWIRYGQKVSFATEAYPGQTFEGKISFIDPILNEMTRTVKVRVVVPNPDGKLKPEMFVRAVVRPQVATAGRVMDPDMAGKWICPMHPEIVKDGPGKCDICGMALVRAEDRGYVAAEITEQTAPLVIPASAPLITGKRAVVYVEAPATDRPTFEGREIVLGPRAGDYYLVESGLREGELVVTSGNFKIDSALQILAKPSMMYPEGGAPIAAHARGEPASPRPTPEPAQVEAAEAPPAFQAQLRGLLKAYLSIQEALAADDYGKATGAVQTTQQSLAAVDMALLTGEAHMRWMDHAAALKSALEEASAAADIEELRKSFSTLSQHLADSIKSLGAGEGEPIYRIRCPMAFEGHGAIWLQQDSAVRNPYFGASMLQCGAVEETFGHESQGHGEGPGHE